MKKYISMLALVWCFASCKKDFLDPRPTDRLNETIVWSSPSLIEAALNYNYNALSYGIYSRNSFGDYNIMLADMTDEAVTYYEGYEQRSKFVNGGLNPDNVREIGLTRLGWNESYNFITRANEFIERIPTITGISQEKIDSYEGEIKLLRAWRYFNLLRHFGGVPLITKTFKPTEDFSQITRATIDETISFIVAEIDQAIAKLPETASVKGRIDKNIAKAFKSRVLLTIASPLYNPANSMAMWQAAANAAKDLIDNGPYSLELDFEKYRQSFIRYDPTNTEMIFVRESDVLTGNGTDEGILPPVSLGPVGSGGYSYFTPLQQFVDAFETADGKAITDPTSGYNAQNPYINREPRFEAFIYHHGSVINGRTLDYRVDDPGTPDNDGGVDRPADGAFWGNPTGYNMKKFINEERFSSDGTAVIGFTNDPVPWIHIRYAEILLNYAEALNEAQPGAADAVNYINKIRNRAGLPDMTGPFTQSALRDKIRHERRIELAFEEHRFWDVRRWKVLETTQSIPVLGAIITGPNPGSVTYRYDKPPYSGYAADRIFLPRNYFWPVTREELRTLPGLTQTPGY